MSRFSTLRLCLLLPLMAIGGTAHASNNPQMDAQVMRINNEWARIKYQVKDKGEQYAQLDKLAQQAAGVVAKYPGRAEPLLWQGIVTSEEAAQASTVSKSMLCLPCHKTASTACATSLPNINGITCSPARPSPDAYPWSSGRPS